MHVGITTNKDPHLLTHSPQKIPRTPNSSIGSTPEKIKSKKMPHSNRGGGKEDGAEIGGSDDDAEIKAMLSDIRKASCMYADVQTWADSVCLFVVLLVL